MAFTLEFSAERIAYKQNGCCGSNNVVIGSWGGTEIQELD